MGGGRVNPVFVGLLCKRLMESKKVESDETKENIGFAFIVRMSVLVSVFPCISSQKLKHIV